MCNERERTTCHGEANGHSTLLPRTLSVGQGGEIGWHGPRQSLVIRVRCHVVGYQDDDDDDDGGGDDDDDDDDDANNAPL